MIEIKISTDAAVALLIDRMKYEFELRMKTGVIPSGTKLADLDSETLIAIAETAALDLIFLLPFEILSQRNNLVEILYKAFRSLSKQLNREEFKQYSAEASQKLLEKVETTFKLGESNKDFQYN